MPEDGGGGADPMDYAPTGGEAGEYGAAGDSQSGWEAEPGGGYEAAGEGDEAEAVVPGVLAQGSGLYGDEALLWAVTEEGKLALQVGKEDIVQTQ